MAETTKRRLNFEAQVGGKFIEVGLSKDISLTDVDSLMTLFGTALGVESVVYIVGGITVERWTSDRPTTTP